MKAHGKKLFVGIENVKGFFLIDIASVHEIEHPYRSCNHAWYLHLWPRKAVVIGWWKKRHDEEGNLLRAVGGRHVEEKIAYGPTPIPGRLRKNQTQDRVDEFA